MIPSTDSHTLPARAWLIAALLSLAFFVAYIQHNTFPDFYHTSEPLKVDQVLGAEYNLRHPLLMLNTARLVMRLTHQPPLRQNAVITGRMCSAFFAAAAVGALALWGYLQRGAAGAWTVGVLVGLQPGLLIAAHYLKEDPYLLFGLASTFLALTWYERRPSLARAAWLGGACGLALSGKYIGIIAIILGLLLVWKVKPRPAQALTWLILAFCLTVFAINFQVFLNLTTLHASVGQEVELLWLDHGEAYVSWDKTRYFELLLESIPWIFLFAALLTTGRMLFRREPRCTWANGMFAVVPLLYLIGLSLFPKGADRYFLPVSTLLSALAGLALADFGRLLSRRWPRCQGFITLLLLGVLAAVFAWPGFSTAMRDFRRDNRRSLADWVRKNLPPTAVLATDNRVALPQPGDARYQETRNYIPQKVYLGKRFAAEFGPLEEMQARHVTHVAIAKNDYGRLFDRPDLLTPVEKAQTAAYKQFYEELFAEGKKVWSIKKGPNRFLQPALEIYQLPPSS